MKESGGGPNESVDGSDGGVRLAGTDLGSRGRPISLAVSADQVRPSHQKRKVGIPSMDRLSSNNNNNLLVSDMSDMSSESDSEFLPPRASGESQGNQEYFLFLISQEATLTYFRRSTHHPHLTTQMIEHNQTFIIS